MQKIIRHQSLLICLSLGVALLLANQQALADHHATAESASAVNPALQAVIDGGHRSAEHKARDQYRHPAETLTWMGLKPDMTVVEISPGRGWYTEILGAYLKDNGKFYAAGYDRESDREYMKNLNKMLDERLANKDVYGSPTVTELAAPEKVDIAPEGSADMVLTFRNTHNWMRAGTNEAIYAAMYKALKPGGTLGVVQHRAAPDSEQDPKASTGYVKQDVVIQMAEKAGFKLAGQSEINANPKDTRDHPKGVWTLPPRYRLGEEDKEKYAAIGESDRMTLKFMKPME